MFRRALFAFAALPFVAMGVTLDLWVMSGGELGQELLVPFLLFVPVLLVATLVGMLVLQGFKAALIGIVALPFIAMGGALDLWVMHGDELDLGQEVTVSILLFVTLAVVTVLWRLRAKAAPAKALAEDSDAASKAATPMSALRLVLLAFVAFYFVVMGVAVDLWVSHGGELELAPEVFVPVLFFGTLAVMMVLQCLLTKDEKEERPPSLRTRTTTWGIRNLGTAASLGGTWKRYGLRRDGPASAPLATTGWASPTKEFARQISNASTAADGEFDRQVSQACSEFD